MILRRLLRIFEKEAVREASLKGVPIPDGEEVELSSQEIETHQNILKCLEESKTDEEKRKYTRQLEKFYQKIDEHLVIRGISENRVEEERNRLLNQRSGESK